MHYEMNERCPECADKNAVIKILQSENEHLREMLAASALQGNDLVRRIAALEEEKFSRYLRYGRTRND
ncbi:MAG TPA: hypothetical protein VLH56_08610 [Dissulfurispiraceae bacterium]|nr:hypothetical protein [Dissulfurispiraceae bacterium]